MLLIMATKTEVENGEVDKPLENQDIIAVCKNLQFTDDDLKFQPSRKRCVSTSIIISSSPKKKKKEGLSMIPPKKFLLGGSISDPLNLNSLQNEDINKAMNKTPKTSPLHSNTVNIKTDQVNVLIPRDLSDPLELAVCDKVKAIACSNDLDALKKNTPLKCKPKKLLSKSLSDSGLLTENTPENDYELKGNKNKMEDDDINMSPPKKKLKIESFGNRVCNPVNNNIPYAIVEVIEQIKEVLDNVESVNQIDKCDIPIQKTPVEVIVEKIVEPCKTKSLLPEKIVEDCMKSQKENKNVKSPKCIVSPVVLLPPSPENPCNPLQVVTTSAKPKQKVNKNVPKFKDKNALFKYGNYNRYYGYRNPDDEDDRLKVLAERMDLFYGKDVLDVGCNIGHVTFSVARDFGAKSVVGMDIDRKLINIARKNVQYYINDRAEFSDLPPNYQFHEHNSHSYNDPNWDITQSFPMSLPMMYGPIDLPGMTITGRFPFNVSFVQGNYVLESDALLSMETCKFDVILCLSITKWIHLNWGDDGLKRTFKRMYAQLRPGGILVVEPQPWKSYGRRKTLTETIWHNYKNIEFKPPMFTEYLIDEVGFVNCETLSIPHNPSKGFQRPLKLYRKPSLSMTRNAPNCTIVRPNETQKL